MWEQAGRLVYKLDCLGFKSCCTYWIFLKPTEYLWVPVTLNEVLLSASERPLCLSLTWKCLSPKKSWLFSLGMTWLTRSTGISVRLNCLSALNAQIQRNFFEFKWAYLGPTHIWSRRSLYPFLNSSFQSQPWLEVQIQFTQLKFSSLLVPKLDKPERSPKVFWVSVTPIEHFSRESDFFCLNGLVFDSMTHFTTQCQKEPVITWVKLSEL